MQNFNSQSISGLVIYFCLFVCLFVFLFLIIGDEPSGSPSKGSTIYGVAGKIKLLEGTYVLVITSRKEVGTYLSFPVFRVTAMKFLSCNVASRFLTNQEKRDKDCFMNLLKIVESTPGLYYSYETDMTPR
ncbi:phosphoinositide phosphatase sac8 [Phtheirospermum japonicum]|uniref:Phosphoinositide phosphatase sac8 n=1 Tax=Phtheirospermum japonicum TaxID=374723 RepID=A0A830CE97_9LAMI|nr:phosphoinositide phosphatase sac8 [Phtheirospermum japonicum]